MYGSNERVKELIGEEEFEPEVSVLRHYVNRPKVTATQLTRYRQAFGDGLNALKMAMRSDGTLEHLESVVVELEDPPYTHPFYGGRVLTHQFGTNPNFRIPMGEGNSRYLSVDKKEAMDG